MFQSQVSQFSDNYPLSIFGDTSLDNLPFLLSDSAQLFNPDVLYGEISTSTSDFNFPLPLLVYYPPDTLQCVGPPRKKNFVLWTEMVNNEFVV